MFAFFSRYKLLLQNDFTNSLFDFAVNKLFMKLFKTTNIEIIKYCQEQFDFHLPNDLIARRTKKFHSQSAGFNS